MRNRPQLVTTISPAMYALLTQEKNRDRRPLSFVLDNALQTWATCEARMQHLEARTRELEQQVSQLDLIVSKYLDKVGM